MDDPWMDELRLIDPQVANKSVRKAKAKLWVAHKLQRLFDADVCAALMKLTRKRKRVSHAEVMHILGLIEAFGESCSRVGVAETDLTVTSYAWLAFTNAADLTRQ